MEQIDLTVRGDRASELPAALRDRSPDSRVDCEGDGFAVIVVEEYYKRTLSDLQVTTVFDLVDETTCEVTVVAGGGSSGLAKDDLGSEGDAARDVAGAIERFCSDRDLDVDRE